MTTSRTNTVKLLAALALFVCAFLLLHVGFYTREQIVDTPVYEEFGTAIVDGLVPYRDFDVEYPPGALPVFVLPALTDADYRVAFEWLMGLCGLWLVAAVALAARRLELGFGPVLFVALSPLAIGSVLLTRFDLWPALLVALALVALLHERFGIGHALLGLSIAAKLYPGVLLPLTVAYVWRRRGRRAALVCGAAALAVVVAAYLPFLIVAPEGVLLSVGRQLSRPLQIESLGSAILLVAHDVLGTGVEVGSSHGSQNLVGPAAGVLAVLQSIAQLAALAAVWLWFARLERPSPRALVVAGAAALTAFVALGKVLSPQFLIWLVPIVPLTGSLGATALLAAAIALTQVWFPFRYWDLVRELDPAVAWLVLGRDLFLLALLALLLSGMAGARHRTGPEAAR